MVNNTLIFKEVIIAVTAAAMRVTEWVHNKDQ